MNYLTELLDFENRLKELEIKDKSIAKYIEDFEGKENWLRKGKCLEQDVLNSSLTREDKFFILDRINNSSQYFKTNSGKKEDMIEKLAPYAIGFFLGGIFVYFLRDFVSKLGEDFGKGLSKGLYKDKL